MLLSGSGLFWNLIGLELKKRPIFCYLGPKVGS